MIVRDIGSNTCSMQYAFVQRTHDPLCCGVWRSIIFVGDFARNLVLAIENSVRRPQHG